MAASEGCEQSWTESSLIFHERGYKRCCYKDDLRLLEEEYKIKSLEDLIQFRPSENHRETLSTGLLTEIRRIKGEYQDGAVVLTATENPSPRKNIDYIHWLPTHKFRLLDRKSSEVEEDWQSILETDYEEFDTICHSTHLKFALKIFKENKLQSCPVRDNSVFSKVLEHPNRATEVTWFGPAKKENIRFAKSSYGNVAFFMDELSGWEGIRRNKGDWKYYFVEVVDYITSSACRILVTRKIYPHLRPYNPTEKGGPWYYDVQTGKDYRLKNIKRWDGTRGDNGNSVEFMREESYSGTKWRPCINRKNLHFCSIKHGYCLKNSRENCDQFSNKDTRLLIMHRACLPDFKPEVDLLDDTAKQALVSILHNDKIELLTADPQTDVMEESVPLAQVTAPDLQPPSPAHGSETDKIAVKAIVKMLGVCLEDGVQLYGLWENVELVLNQKPFRDVLQNLGNEDQNLRDAVSDANWNVAAAAAIQCGTELNEIVSNMHLFPSFDHSSCEPESCPVKRAIKALEDRF